MGAGVAQLIESVGFEFDAQFEKAWQDEHGKMHVSAFASDDGLDLQRDRMSDRALNKMAEACRRGLPLLESHRNVFEFGKTVDGQVVSAVEEGKPVRKLLVESVLNGDYPQARTLFREVADKQCTRQLSIGGKLNLKNKDAVAIEMGGGGLVRVIHDIDLDHIACTRWKQAANPRTSFVAAITKSLGEAEQAGWVPPQPEQADVAKDAGSAQGEPERVSTDDVKAGLGFLSSVGKAMRSLFGRGDDSAPGGEDMGAQAEMINRDTATTGGTTAGPHTDLHPSATAPGTPKDDPAQAGLEGSEPKGPYAGKDNAPATSGPSSEDLARQIVALLAKRAAASQDELGDAIYRSLWTSRYALAKEAVSGAALGEGEKQAASKIVQDGPTALYAPRDLSAAKGTQAFQADKAVKGDSTNVAGTNVTGANNNIQLTSEYVPGEKKIEAPTAKSALDLTTKAAQQADALGTVNPTVPAGAQWPSLRKDLGADGIEKALRASEERGADISKQLVVAAVESLVREQGSLFGGIQKSLGDLGGMLNDMSRRLADVEGRVNRVEKGGAVSHSGPRGTTDSTIPIEKSRGAATGGNVFAGFLSRSLAAATAKHP